MTLHLIKLCVGCDSIEHLAEWQKGRIAALKKRGAKAEREYLRWFPRLSAAYSLRDDLIARVAGYQSLGAPNFNQYSGGITLPDVESPPAAANRITANNPAIKPWTAWTTSVASAAAASSSASPETSRARTRWWRAIRPATS